MLGAKFGSVHSRIWTNIYLWHLAIQLQTLVCCRQAISKTPRQYNGRNRRPPPCLLRQPPAALQAAAIPSPTSHSRTSRGHHSQCKGRSHCRHVQSGGYKPNAPRRKYCGSSMDMALALSLPTGCLSPPASRESVNVARRPSPASISAPPLFSNGLSPGCSFGAAPAHNRRCLRTLTRMGLRAVETFDGSFKLKPECESDLKALLASETFCKQVSEQPGVVPGADYEFTGELFQPVPWSVNTKHGMPQEFEKYLEDKDNFAIINIPPNFMFKAKVFHPSRLCAVYRKRVTS